MNVLLCHISVHLKSLWWLKKDKIFFFQSSHHQIRPSVAHEACQIHMNGPAR